MVSVVIHTNLWLANQLESAQWLAEGFQAHGITAEVTGDKTKAADVHVVQGPHYCFDYWRQRSADHRVLWLNRCFYGHDRFDLSIGWLRPDGSRDFRIGSDAVGKGILPQLRQRKHAGRAAVVFADYGRSPDDDIAAARKTYDAVFFRPHPREPRQAPVLTLSGPLDGVWALADVAIGHSTTALVQAEIEGLRVVCSDPLHVVHHDGDRERWLNRLSWCQWNHEEIKRGDFWSHLQ